VEFLFFPILFIVASTKSLISAKQVTSHLKLFAIPLKFKISFLVFSALFKLVSVTIIEAPAFANAIALDFPRPDPQPFTISTFPVKLNKFVARNPFMLYYVT